MIRKVIFILACTSLFGIALPGGASCAEFFDDFNREVGSGIGNGWIEKNPGVFLHTGQDVETTTSLTHRYQNNIVYRPSDEALLNSEVSVEFTWSEDQPEFGYPQIHSRIQDSVTNWYYLDSYLFFINNDPSQAILARTRNDGKWKDPELGGAIFATIIIDPPLQPGNTYRMTLSAIGDHPVELRGYIERQESDGEWSATPIATAWAFDTGSDRITTAGVAGFSGHAGDNYSYDNFSVIEVEEVGTEVAGLDLRIEPQIQEILIDSDTNDDDCMRVLSLKGSSFCYDDISVEEAVFQVTVSNPGDTELKGVRVIDPRAPKCSRFFSSLAPGDSVTYTCNRVVRRSFVNFVWGFGKDVTGEPVTDADKATVNVVNSE